MIDAYAQRLATTAEQILVDRGLRRGNHVLLVGSLEMNEEFRGSKIMRPMVDELLAVIQLPKKTLIVATSAVAKLVYARTFKPWDDSPVWYRVPKA